MNKISTTYANHRAQGRNEIPSAKWKFTTTKMARLLYNTMHLFWKAYPPQKCFSQWGIGYLLSLCVITLNIVNISAQWEHGDYIGQEQVLSVCTPQVSRSERASHTSAEIGEAGWQPSIMTSVAPVGEQNLAVNWMCCWGPTGVAGGGWGVG